VNDSVTMAFDGIDLAIRRNRLFAPFGLQDC
jgi:hypothetical protein